MILFVVLAWAASVGLVPDTTDVREGQTIGLTLTVTDTVAEGVPPLEVPAGLSVEFQGQSQSRMVVNFNVTSTVSFRYALTATRAGEYTLGPVAIPTRAGVLRTTAVPLRVSPRGAAGALDELTADLGSTRAWVGQVLVYHLRFETARQLVSGTWGAPSGPGFNAEASVKPGTAEYQVGQGSELHTVSELFFPIRLAREGSVTVPGGIYRGQFAVQGERRSGRRGGGIFDDLAAMSQVSVETFSAPPRTLQVLELPTEGRPADFSGLVGSFSVRAEASGRDVAVGDTVTVSVEVTGDAPLGGIKLPPLEGTGFRVYEDQPSTEIRLVDGRIEASASFKRAIVPSAPGELVIPPTTLAWFDPVRGVYQQQSTEPITLTVSGSAADAAVASFAGPERAEVGALADDILPVRTEGEVDPPWSGRWAALLLLPGAGGLAAAALTRLRRRPRVEVDQRYDFGHLPADPEGRLAGLDRIFRERVAERLGVSPAALRREDVSRLGPEAEAVFRELERLRYSGAASGPLPEDAVRRVVEGR